MILLLLLSAVQCHANAADLLGEGLWARASPPGAPNGVAYGRLTNAGPEALEIVGLASLAARTVQIHETFLQDDMMRMRRIDPVTLQPGESVTLQPGGKHFMLIGISQPLRGGEEVLVDVSMASSEVVTLTIPVLPPGETGPEFDQ
ncbi:MAG: copper chaperone PCu(A)C [Pseudomonadales bacterium]|nr:copper chaperone PCu(A)C [Pseudomonadales bacterium]